MKQIDPSTTSKPVMFITVLQTCCSVSIKPSTCLYKLIITLQIYTLGKDAFEDPAGWSRMWGVELSAGAKEDPTQTLDLSMPRTSFNSTELDTFWLMLFSEGPQAFFSPFSVRLINPISCSQVDSPAEGESKTNDQIDESSAADGQPE